MEKLVLYTAFFWEKDEKSFGKRVEIFARNADEAESMILEKYGNEIMISLHNEEEADKVR